MKIPALKRPTLKELQKNRSWIKSIESDQSTTKAVEVEFVSVLKEGETHISGSEYETRLKLRDDVKLGYQHMKWLLENQKEFPEFMALLGKVYIDFPALVVVRGDGSRDVPYVHDGGGRFGGYWSWLVHGFDVDGRIAVSSKVATPGTSETGSSRPLDTLPLETRVKNLEEMMERIKKAVYY